MLAQDDLERAIVGRYQRLTVEKPGFDLREVLRITAFTGSHANVIYGPSMARK